ncbi:MAG: hypothetical protein ACE15F_14110 [bacterium]
MAERFMPIGQFMPATARLNQGRVPSTYVTRAPGESNHPSFQEVMDKTPANSTSVNANPTSGNGNTNASNTPPLNAQTALQEGWTLAPTGQQNFNQGLTSSVTKNVPVDSKTYTETNRLLQNMPPNYPQGEQLADLMLKNMRDYQKSKSAQAIPAATDPKPMTPQRSGLESQMVAEPDLQSVSLMPEDGETAIYPSALSRAFTQGMEDPNPPIPPAAITVPPGQRGSTAGAETWTTADGTLIRFPSNEEPMRPVKREETIPSAQEQKSKITERKGFFQAIGSFFGDMASGLTLGIYRPKNEPAPQGVERIFYPVKKLIFDAPVKDLAVGIPAGIYHDTGRVFGPRKEQDVRDETSAVEGTPRSFNRRRSEYQISLSDLNHPQRAFRRKADA